MATIQEAVHALHTGRRVMLQEREVYLGESGVLHWGNGGIVPIVHEFLDGWSILPKAVGFSAAVKAVFANRSCKYRRYRTSGSEYEEMRCRDGVLCNGNNGYFAVTATDLDADWYEVTE